MKIAIFTDTYTPQINGVAKTLERLTRYFSRTGIDHIVFAPQNVKDELEKVHVEKVKSIPFAIYPECRIALPNLYFIKKKLLRFRPDLIHVATPFNMGLVGRYYAGKLGIPLVGSFHTDFDAYLNYYKMEFLSPILWNYMRWFHNSMEKTFVPSQETLVQLQEKGFTHLDIWSRGVDCRLFGPSDDSTRNLREKYGIGEKYILSYVGRLAPEKDIETLEKIIEKIGKNRAGDVHWLIAGDGPLSGEMKARFTKHITFTGYLTPAKLAHVYAGSDLMVFPSPTETFGNVVLESMACGTPVIGADAGGVRNIISSEINGALCPPKDDDAFVSAVNHFLDNDAQRQAAGASARSYALTQSWDRIFEKLLNDYDRVLTHQDSGLLHMNG